MPDDLQSALACLEAADRDGAHAIVQSDDTADAAWVHAHLHRIEGDLPNARYWYGRAGRAVETGDLDAERKAIVDSLRRP